MTALYNLLGLIGGFIALRISLLIKTRRVIIITVMRTLSETEIEYGIPMLMVLERQMVQVGCEI